MTDEWREYIVRDDTSLHMLLFRFHYDVSHPSVHSDPFQARVWNHERNLPLHSPDRGSGSISLQRGDHLWLPPPTLPPRTELRRCSFQEGRRTVADVLRWIADHRGPRSQAPYVSSQPLFGLGSVYFDYWNIRFANQHPRGPDDPGEIGPEEYLEYLVEPRPAARAILAGPTDAAGRAAQTVLAGPPAFEVTVELGDSTLQPFVNDRYRHPVYSSISFQITVQKRGSEEPRRITLRIFDSGGHPYYVRTYEAGDPSSGADVDGRAFLRTGTFQWAWHGYANVQPREHDVLDTTRLEGGFVAEVIVEANRGTPGIGQLRFLGRKTGPAYLSSRIDLHWGDASASSLEIRARLRIRKATQEWVLFALTPLLAGAAAGGLVLLEFLGSLLSNATVGRADPSLAIDDASRDRFMIWTAILGPIVLAGLMSAYLAAASPMTDEQMSRIKDLILVGLREHLRYDDDATYQGRFVQELTRPTDHRVDNMPDEDFVRLHVHTTPVEAMDEALAIVLSKDVPLIGAFDLSSLSDRLPMIVRVPDAVVQGTATSEVTDRFVYDTVRRIAKVLAGRNGSEATIPRALHALDTERSSTPMPALPPPPIDILDDYTDMTASDVRRARIGASYVHDAVARCSLMFRTPGRRD